MIDSLLHHSRFLKYFLLFLTAVMLFSCEDGSKSDYSNSNADSSSYLFSLNWPDGTPVLEFKSTASRELDCTAAGVDSIVAHFYDESDKLLKNPPDEFLCSAHSGQIKGLPPGNNYYLWVTAENSAGIILYQGEETGIDLVVGQNYGNEIQMRACVVENCSDGEDNDCDQLIDCDDPDCAEDIACLACTDFDLDTYYKEDGCGTAVDCDDNDDTVYPGATEVCDDGKDNDCDGYTDCEDSDCFGNATCPIINNLGMKFNRIQAGTFTMGSPDGISEYPIGIGETPAAEPGRENDEKPHQVTLTQPFYMQTTEVSQGQWEAVITQAENEGILDPGELEKTPSYFSSCGSECPVEQVSWNEIQTFISALNQLGEGSYRLPSEAEWEYAARAGKATAFASGDIAYYIDMYICDYDSKLTDIGWYCYNTSSTTHPVKQKQANAWGLYDMHGNTYEWCQDWYGSYPTNSVIDPTGPVSGTSRVARGGSWNDNARACRLADRGSRNPDSKGIYNGFRLVCEPSCTNSLGMTFNLIPAGTFMMGSPNDEPGRRPDETQHQVTLSESFYIQRTEVTQGQWEAVMGNNPSNPIYGIGNNYPVNTISWSDIQTFIDALNSISGGTYRLPTESEWEYAARAGATTAFANGDITASDTSCDYDPNLGSIGWYCGNNSGASEEVGQKQPNAFGLYDMHGNAWEWCHDWYGEYPTTAVTDPTGPIAGIDRVFRGGAWYDRVGTCRSARRDGNTQSFTNYALGFRTVYMP